MVHMFMKFRDADDGATAVEYGLIAALVSLTLIAALAALGSSLENLSIYLSNVVDQALGPGGGSGTP